MATGTGFYDRSNRIYLPKDAQTWDDYQGSSAGDDWDSFTSWYDTTNLSLPMEYETDYFDAGSDQTYLVTTNVGSGGFWHTYIYAHLDDTDSAGDLAPSGIGWSEYGPYYPGDSVPAIRGRFFKIKIVFEAASSAGEFFNIVQRFRSISINATVEKITETVYVSNNFGDTFGGTAGNRTYVCRNISIPTNVQVTLGLPTEDPYVQADYVGELDSAGGTEIYVDAPRRTRPVCYASSGNNPTVNLDTFDMNSFSKNRRMDAPIYMRVEGYPYLTVDEHGNVKRG